MNDQHAAKKRFGQNFLHDAGVIDRIIRSINPLPHEAIIEIGPGLGALTVPLLRKLGKLRVIELDRDVIPHLKANCGDDVDNLDIVMADALKVDYSTLAPAQGKLRLVGNLPYNISTPILFHLLRYADHISDMHFMLQKEVVDRMAAEPGDDDYGRLTVALAARAHVSKLFTVGPGAFNPAPKVDSAIVRLVPRPPAFEIVDHTLFDRIVAAAFSQRRKTLSNGLKTLMTADQIREAGIDPGIRAERLSAAEFASLTAVAARSLTP
ncbi:16S rRNA (adenine(1518)-N(6)/adenine(1519)-N(6))-dimethyltransferase RsmA [Stenotrophobium rhamnosiphilum]|uniref:Ribosomal RNA small subunit methyltransferase A n=1 Tax=Stenotrophobium rhamnosiphilum TaxID=2029166 RepID=A0A2T5ML22_9GAMM|nr:16S rRNA (adenine(1518)-N(6)/adenine(1519)-N(6))-dimethyltransferase RsmA [Stenotrophobium rhamnosiphilum]PTU33270.1 16S rRNA (adenine(1518)-N(6)/adenine(1519)-N(6))-dimethyltransferase [Stenotrophobium rhamnosiphilum]